MQSLYSLVNTVSMLHHSTLPELVAIVNTMSLHVGEYKLTASSNDMNGWLQCDGRSLSRATYAGLFAVTGTAFGAADAASFSLPDFRGRAIGLAGQGVGLTNRAVGDVVGEERHLLSTTEMPSHTHAGTTDAAGAHSHVTNAVGGSVGLAVCDGSGTAVTTDVSAGELNVWTTPRALTVNADGSHTHAFTTGATGGGAAHNNMQPTLFAGNVLIFSGLLPGQGASWGSI